jgi:hypothetical protein
MKKLCKRVLEGQLESNLNKFIKKVADPLFVCVKCGRMAHNKASLCKPVSLDDIK